METERKTVYEVRCMNCGKEMPRIVPMGLAMEGGNVRCPKCNEDHSYMIGDDRLTLKRRSVPIGFRGDVEKTFAPVSVRVDTPSPPRPSSVDEAYEQFREQAEKLPERESIISASCVYTYRKSYEEPR